MRKYVIRLLDSVDLGDFELRASFQLIRLCQQICQQLLPSRLASWRYKRGFRSLEANLKEREEGNTVKTSAETLDNKEETESEDFCEADEQRVLQMVEIVLRSLRNDADEVRMAAAKCVGRICSRLSQSHSVRIIERVITENLKPSMSASAWHGGCVAVAELSSRGCLLPHQLAVVVPLISDALLFDRQCNGNVTEANVRDAACYICWAFARAYSVEVLGPHVSILSYRLLCTSLFDREVNVRRAASASFQENVGRHGGFSNGIPILVIIDFIAVGILRHCYEDLVIKVAEYTEYRRPMLEFLCKHKTTHWDERIRHWTATAIRRLAKFEVDYVIDELFPLLCKNLNKCSNSDYVEIHGFILGISAIIESLFVGNEKRFQQNSSLRLAFDFLFRTAKDLHFTSAKESTFMAKAICVFAETLTNINFPLEITELNELNDLLETVLMSNSEEIFEQSRSAFCALFEYYLRNEHSALMDIRFQKYLRQIGDGTSKWPIIRALVAVSAVPVAHYINNNDETQRFLSLLYSTILKPPDAKWYLCKQMALRTLFFGLNNVDLSQKADWETVFCSVWLCLRDQTKTEQGDVGRYVREEALSHSLRLLELTERNGILNDERLDKTIGSVLERCSDSVDRTRMRAINTMISLLNSKLPIAEKETLLTVFGKSDSNWFTTFPPLQNLLGIWRYRPFVLRGLLHSSGSLLVWTAEHSQTIIGQYLSDLSEKETAEFLEEIVEMAEKSDEEAEVAVFVAAFQRLFSDRLFAAFEEEPDQSPEFVRFCEFILTLSSKKSKARLRHLVIQTLGSLMVLRFDSEMGRRVRQKLVSFLTSPYAALRGMAAEQLNEGLNLSGDDVYGRENIQTALEILSETLWADQSTSTADSAHRLHELLH